MLEYANDGEVIVREFYQILKLSIVKHNRNGRIMQVVVLLNNFDEANSHLDGHNSNIEQFGTINYYDDGDIPKKVQRLHVSRILWIENLLGFTAKSGNPKGR